MASKHLKVGNYRPARETQLKWCFSGGPMVAQHCILAGFKQCNVRLCCRYYQQRQFSQSFWVQQC